jgi:hypothetical protein
MGACHVAEMWTGQELFDGMDFKAIEAITQPIDIGFSGLAEIDSGAQARLILLSEYQVT